VEGGEGGTKVISMDAASTHVKIAALRGYCSSARSASGDGEASEGMISVVAVSRITPQPTGQRKWNGEGLFRTYCFFGVHRICENGVNRIGDAQGDRSE
jgi:hypothetical protein